MKVETELGNEANVFNQFEKQYTCKKKEPLLTAKKSIKAEATTKKAIYIKRSGIDYSHIITPNHFPYEVYNCEFIKGCTFRAVYFEDLSRHLDLHKRNKRRNNKTYRLR